LERREPATIEIPIHEYHLNDPTSRGLSTHIPSTNNALFIQQTQSDIVKSTDLSVHYIPGSFVIDHNLKFKAKRMKGDISPAIEEC